MNEVQTSEYVKTLQQIDLSSTQCIRVGVVKIVDSKKSSKLAIAIQKFWRKNKDAEFLPSKGFYVDRETALSIYNGLGLALRLFEPPVEDEKLLRSITSGGNQ